MSYNYTLHNEINLHVKERISCEDAERQTRTARDILKRFGDQPGIILADEVGMGKTFISLAVAASIALQDQQKRPIVVMVPSSLKDKWPKDFNLFKEKCLPQNLSKKLNYGFSEKAVDFLKYLDDPKEQQRSIIFLTHGAMSRGLTDGWVKLAIIKRALYKRKDIRLLKRALSRILGDLLYLKWASVDEGFWFELLESHPGNWLKILKEYGIDPEHDFDEITNDDPVPQAIIDVLEHLPTSKLDDLYQALCRIPLKSSPYLYDRIKEARTILNKNIKVIWEHALRSLRIKLPLLILDEAHHLKNANTRLASLFSTEESENDADEFSKGALAGIFERMLFLTATPFQLGHYELCSVLERFNGISWLGQRSPEITVQEYRKEIDALREKLDHTLQSSLRFQQVWNRIQLPQPDLNLGQWWEDQLNSDSENNEIKENYKLLKCNIEDSEELLKKYVIRHNKNKYLTGNYANVKRREKLVGCAILDDNVSENEKGLEIQDKCILPFLLASRAVILNLTERPVFAEGLASSYEAFLNTRRSRNIIDEDDENTTVSNEGKNWYYKNIEKFISSETRNLSDITHPKIAATVNKAVNLWMKGEKVLIFCHYIATGKCLRQYISNTLNNFILKTAADKFKCDPYEAERKLANIGDRFFVKDSKFMIEFDKKMTAMISGFPAVSKMESEAIEIIKRYIRTPSFLVRYFPLDKAERFGEEALMQAMQTHDLSGLTLEQTILNFFIFLEKKCGEDERNRYMDALLEIQTGSILASDVSAFLKDDEVQGEREERLIPNVRLVNGDTKSETRQNLMLTFNTPFYPDILITSSVLAEGVDLHLNCRFIIHHDLSWNPSTLEQRTGRVDRIGAKAETSGKSINVYIPYVSETQDEKMYRVVTDREQWFKFIMGSDYKNDVKSTDKTSERIPLPKQLTEELSYNLEV